MKHLKIFILLFISIFYLLKTIEVSAQDVEQDWANLAKYQKENSNLEMPKEKEARIVFMGNSITEGWLIINPDFFEGKPYVDRGISGQTTPQMLLRFRQDVINLKPKIVVILAGTNDIAENTGPITLTQIKDNILSMVELSLANNIQPIVCSVLPAYEYQWSPGKNPDVKIPKLNKLIKKMCQEKGVTYLDYFSKMADDRNGLPKEYTHDEVHLTKEGYAVMEKLVKKTIKNLLR